MPSFQSDISSSPVSSWTRGKRLCGVIFLLSVFLGATGVYFSFSRDYANYALYADQFDQTAWAHINASVDADAAEAPDGSMTAEKITSNGVDGYLSQAILSLKPGVYDYSVYLRSDQNTGFAIYMVTSKDGISYIAKKTVSVSPGWRRFNMRATVYEGYQLAIQIGGGATFEEGKSAYAWGAQVTRLPNHRANTPSLLITEASIAKLSDASPFETISSSPVATLTAPLLILAIILAYLFFADNHRRKFGHIIEHYFPLLTTDILNYPSSAAPNFSVRTFLAAIFASWVLFLQLSLTTPLAVFLSQPDAYAISLVRIIAAGAGIAALLGAVTTLALSLLPRTVFTGFVKLLVSISLAVAFEQLLLADIRPFGELTGQPVPWDEYAAIAKIDAAALVLIIAAGLYFLRNVSIQHVASVSGLIMLFAMAPPLVFAITDVKTVIEHQRNVLASKDYTPFFEFSDTKNIFYYQPDSVSSDVVKKLFEDYPELAQEFEGFTFFADNAGAYNGTLLSTYSVFTGRNADIYDNGYSEEEFIEAAKEFGFPQKLEENGYQTEFVPVYGEHCAGAPRLCIERHIADLTPKSLSQLGSQDARKDWLLLLDVSLFRHAPHFVKKHVYNNGDWILRDYFKPWYSTKVVGVGPVLKEVTDNITINKGPPRFKWYAGLGAHRPEQYDENCQPLPGRIYSVEAGVNQTLCVLREYAAFLKELKKAGVYDTTALIFNADTGSGNLAFDLVHPPNAAHNQNKAGLEPNLDHISMARPALLVKPLHARGRMNISLAQTHQVNLPATVLDLADIPSDYDAPSVFDLTEDDVVRRKFFRIYFPIRYANTHMDFDEYDIVGPANHWASYKLKGWFRKDGSPIPPPPDAAADERE